MNRKLLLLPIVLVGLSVYSVGHGATWKKLADFPSTVSVIKCFPNSLVFVGLGKSPGSLPDDVGIWRSTDAGNTWSVCSIPESYIGELTDFAMLNAQHGFAAVATSSQGALWETTDAGVTWQDAQTSGNFTGIYLTPAGMIVSDLYNESQISFDQGATFQTLAPSGMNGIDFVDDLHGVMTTYRGQCWQFTSDGGLTWNLTQYATESWSVYAVKGTSTFYAAPEGSSRNSLPIPSPIVRSTDFGQTWDTITMLPFRGTGTMVGSGDQLLYAQFCFNANPGVGGVYQSTDRGATWQSIGGPAGWNDSRMAVLTGSCGGTTLFAPDQKGGLWAYGGDGLMNTRAGVFSTVADGEQFVRPLETLTLGAAVQIPQGRKLDTMNVQSIAYTIIYDPTIIDMDVNRLSTLIQPPAGWTVTASALSNGVLNVTITNTSNQSDTNALQLGKFTFVAYGASKTYTVVVVGSVLITTTDGTLLYCGGEEGDFLANVVISSESVAPNASKDIIFASPNPVTNGSLVLNVKLLEPTLLSYGLYDVLGRQIPLSIRNRIHLQPGDHTIPFDFQSLSDGTYYLRVVTNGVARTLKCMVAR